MNAPNNSEIAAGSTTIIDSLPPVKIDVFCRKSQEAVKKVVIDRRASRANISLFDGGADDATGYYADRPSPDLLIVEIPGKGDELISVLETLASVCVVGTHVIIIGDVNDIETYHKVMDLGVSDYLAYPVAPMQLLASISSVFSSGDRRDSLGRTLAFIGSRGGVGSSSVAHNMIWKMGSLTQRQMLLIDFDFAFGTLALSCNLEPNSGSYDLVNASRESLNEKLFERLCIAYDPFMSALLAPSSLDRDIPEDPNLYTNVIQFSRRMSSWVAVDLPHIWTAWSKAVLLEADDIIITATPDLASLRNCKNIFDMLHGRRENDRLPFVVLNQTKMSKSEKIDARDFEKLLSVKPIAEIPFDPIIFGDAATNGKRLDEISSRSRVVSAVNHAARRILDGEQVRTEKRKKGVSSLSTIFSGLMRSK